MSIFQIKKITDQNKNAGLWEDELISDERGNRLINTLFLIIFKR